MPAAPSPTAIGWLMPPGSMRHTVPAIGSVAQTRGLLPRTWVGRGVRLEYVDAYESAQETSGILLDIYPVGPILSLGGAKTCLSWDRVVLVELVED